MAVYCSDVSGAFDRVSALRLAQKLRTTGLHEHWVRLLMSWLRDRSAHVVVSGANSNEQVLSNMVYQGTVWGPSLWNVYFADVRTATAKCGFTEKVYADDLNCYKDYTSNVPNDVLLDDTTKSQAEIHK